MYGCDLFISATGVSPAGDRYRDEVGVDTDGVVVDHNMVTSTPRGTSALPAGSRVSE